MMLLLLFGISAPSKSQEVDEELDNDVAFDALKAERDNATNEIEQALIDLEQERQKLKTEVQEQRISLDAAKLKYVDIEGKYSAIVTNLKFTNEKREEIISEYRLYRHQERAKVVFPLILAAAAYGFSNRDGRDRVVDGFAGYGVASALEAVGLGLGKPIGRLTFKLTEW